MTVPPALRETAVRTGAIMALLAATALLVRGAAQVLPLGIALAVALLLVMLLPGLACARLLGVAEQLEAPVLLAVAIPLGCAVWAIVLIAGLLVGLPLVAVTVVIALFCAVVLALPGDAPHVAGSGRTLASVAAAGVGLAVLASRYETTLHGDALFHAGRVRKLLDLPRLSLEALSSVWHGSPHAGYVVPVLHAIEAAAIGITGAEPSAAYSSLAIGCAVLLPAAAYGLGAAAAGRNAGAALALLATWDTLQRGSLETLQQPPTFTFYVLVPAALALLCATARSRFDRPLARASLLTVLAVALIHASYAIVPLACMAAVVIVTRQGWRLLGASLALTGVIYGVIWAVALRGGAPSPPQPPVLGSIFVTRGGDPVVAQAHWMLDGRPEIALGVLAVVPLMLLYRRRHHVAASIMGAALVLCSFPGVPALLTSVFGFGQVKRFPRSGLPWELTAAIVLVEVAAVLGARAAIPAAVALAVASIAYQVVVPEGWLMTLVITVLTVAGVAVSVWPAIRRRPAQLNAAAPAALGAALLLVVALIAGSVREQRSAIAADLRHGPGLGQQQPRVPDSVIAYFRRHDSAPFPVVLAEAYIGYQLAGVADIYPVALPIERSRGELRNRPRARTRAVNIALHTSAAARARILASYHARYVVINTDTTHKALPVLAADPNLHQVLHDGSWYVFERR